MKPYVTSYVFVRDEILQVCRFDRLFHAHFALQQWGKLSHTLVIRHWHCVLVVLNDGSFTPDALRCRAAPYATCRIVSRALYKT